MENIVESVGLVIHTKDNKEKEIPLEPWQLEVFTLFLGLQVNLSNLDDYKMSSKKSYDERIAIYKDAIKKMHREMSDIND